MEENGKIRNICLGLGCEEKVEPPMHFCSRCLKELKKKKHGKKVRDPDNIFSRVKTIGDIWLEGKRLAGKRNWLI